MANLFALTLKVAALVVLLLPGTVVGQEILSEIPRMPDRQPNFTGVWQALGTAWLDDRLSQVPAEPSVVGTAQAHSLDH